MIKKLLSVIFTVLLFMSILSSVSVSADENYIEIYDRADLEAISLNPNANYILMADINLGDSDWYPIEFNGIFEGNNHTLYNIYITKCNSNPSDSVDGNNKHYDTYYAGLFSKTENALIRNLNLLNVDVNIHTDNHCFAAGLVGHSIDTEIVNCSVKGRVYVYSTAKMWGVGGIAGFGYGLVDSCSTDVTLVCVDEDSTERCEQFMGAVMACGYPDIKDCNIKMTGYASVQGYVHNGGMVGMHHIHTSYRTQKTYVKNNTVDAVITFYENNKDRRAYCKAVVGEKLNKYLTISNNTVLNYSRNEIFEYDKVLLPCTCEDSEYTAEVTEYTCTELGWTTYTCSSCGYSYTDDYTSPAHRPGEFVTVREASYEEAGLIEQRCTECGELLYSEILPKLIYVDTVMLAADYLEMEYKTSLTLEMLTKPDNAEVKDVLWSSSDDNIAVVDQNGKITAVGKGEATITCASADGNASAECNIAVKYSFKQWLIIILLFGWLWY